MVAIFRRFFAIDRMVKKEHLRGELPSSREAYGNLLTIALPSVLEMVLMSLIGSIDTAMVATLGEAQMAGVSLTAQPRMLMLCMFMALNIGVTAIVARRKGQGDQKDANQTLRNALVIVMIFAAVIMSIVLPLSRQLMSLAGAKSDTIDFANTYFRVQAWFLPVNALTLCINAAQRGIGNTKTTMWVNITANVVNVIFNYLLIGGHFGFPALGVFGAAVATAIGYCVGCAMAIASLILGTKAGGFLQVSLNEDWRLKKGTVSAIFKTGGNAMIEQLMLRIGFFTYARIVADLGTASVAAHHTCMQCLSLSFTFADGLAVAGTSLVGQMLGKKRPDLSVVYGKCSQRLAFGVAIVLASTIIMLREPIVRIFLDPVKSPEAFPLALQVMLIVALFQPLQTSAVVFSGCLRGAGDTKYVAKVMMICVALIRPICALLAVHVFKMNLIGAWMASLIDMTLRMVLVARRFGGGKWHDIKV